MADKSVHQGGCHCGAVRFEAATDMERVIACNCSICAKQGLWLTFVPAADFKLVAGEGALKDYQFGQKRIHHMVCSTCGVEPFGRGKNKDGADMFAVNVRCFDDVDISTLTPKPFDGKSL